MLIYKSSLLLLCSESWLKTIYYYMYLLCTQMNSAVLHVLSIYTWTMSGRFLKWSVNLKRPVSRWIKRLDIEMIKATVARTIIPVIIIVIFGLVGVDVLPHIWLGFGCNWLLSKTIQIRTGNVESLDPNSYKHLFVAWIKKTSAIGILHFVCPGFFFTVCKFFHRFLTSSPEQLGQFQPNLANNITKLNKFTFVKMKGKSWSPG